MVTIPWCSKGDGKHHGPCGAATFRQYGARQLVGGKKFK